MSELIGTLAHDLGSLLRKELQLLSVEMLGKGKTLARGVAVVTFGGALAFAGVFALLLAAIAALQLTIPLWASAATVGLLVLVSSYLVVRGGMAAIRRIDLVPAVTLQTLSDGAKWSKEQLR